MHRTIFSLLLAALALPAAARAVTIENRALSVQISPETGQIRVTEKAGGVWEQPAGATAAATRISLHRGSAARVGDAPVAITARMLGDAAKVDGDADCSARVWLSWDEAHLYLAADVTDDTANFGPSDAPVWERDSLEVWIGSRQISLALSPAGSTAFAQGSERLSGGRIAVTPREGGYSVEAALPWSWAGAPPKEGSTVRLAIGVNDADGGAREGQIYWPRGWVHSQAATFAEARLADASGGITSGPGGAAAVYRVLSQQKNAVEVERDFDAGAGRRVALRLRFSLPDAAAPDLRVEARPADLQAPIGDIRFLEPFVLDAPRAVLAVADYGNGHLYPLNTEPFPRWNFSGDNLDMPWVGLCDLGTGRGYLLLLETSDDAGVGMQRVAGRSGKPTMAPTVTWRPQKGTFGYARRILYHFAPRGGYVALCKRYRDHARTQGLIVPFTEKVKKTPHLPRLFGAPDVWGAASLSFARQARAAGVEKMLIHGRPASPADMRAINDLGYLTSEYDNYTDILPTQDGTVTNNRAHIPDDAVMRADNERMKAWLTFDGKTQYMKRCPSLWVDAARQQADRVLKEWPFLGRFIDVTTAEGLYECYDPKHLLTKTQKRACGPALIGAFRERKLVMGGEHGRWWAVPALDYIEGMMSGGYASWPAGHLIHPKSKEEEFTYPGGNKTGKWADYAKWGIGHEWRAPLWELVFHDCIVTTWYWGDASDWLLDAAPEITPRKDAFNVLYGTIPLMWANAGGAWQKDRAVFLRTYRNTCRLHEVIATAALISHEFVTPDHAVQRTRFSDGTTCVVNFGEKPASVTLAGTRYLLPRNGWAVNGPKVRQSLALESGAPVTTIRAPGYAFSDRGGVPLTARLEGPGRLRVAVDGASPDVSLRPADVAPTWRPEGAVAYHVDTEGRTTDTRPLRIGAGGQVHLGAVEAPTTLLLLWGEGARQPDLRITGLKVAPAAPRQGDPLRITVGVANAGLAPAAKVPVDVLVDGLRVHRAVVDVAARGQARVVAEIDTRPLDGQRRVTVALDPANVLPELSEENNRAEQSLRVAPDWSRWPRRKLLSVSTGKVDRQDEPVVVPFSLPAGADPFSLRVAVLDAAGNPTRAVPAQLDGDTLCFVLPGRLPAGAEQRLALLWADAAPARFVPLGAPAWHESERAVVMDGYEARFTSGSLTFLAPRRGGVTGSNFLANLILSSQATGWSDEHGTVESFRVERSGPVRVTVAVRKALAAGVTYEKRYDFYPRRFDVEISLNKAAGGLYSRAHYLLPGTYVDDKGITAVVDGKGDAEGVYSKNQDPKWYAVYAPGWAHSCVALSPFQHVAYWDAGQMGAIGLVADGRTEGIRMSYGIHPGASDASFAARDAERLATPVEITWE